MIEAALLGKFALRAAFRLIGAYLASLSKMLVAALDRLRVDSVNLFGECGEICIHVCHDFTKALSWVFAFKCQNDKVSGRRFL